MRTAGPQLGPAIGRRHGRRIGGITLSDEDAVPESDMFLDSPLTIKATKIFQQRGWNANTRANPFESVRASGGLKFLEKPGTAMRWIASVGGTSSWRTAACATPNGRSSWNA